MHILLLPLLLVVLFQGILPFSMLLSSGVKSIMESNAVDLDSYLVENSKVIGKCHDRAVECCAQRATI